MIDVEKLISEFVPNPDGIVGSFITYLAANASRIGNCCSLAFYRQERMERMATEYLDIYTAKPDEVDELYRWVARLPWPEHGRLALAFDWQEDRKEVTDQS